MKIICLLCFGLTITTLHAQNDFTNYRHAIKIYNQTSFNNYQKSTIVQDSVTNVIPGVQVLQIFHPTIALEWKTGANLFHEFELTELRYETFGAETETIYATGTSTITQVVNGDATVQMAISVRYELILGAKQTTQQHLVPSIGFGVQPFYEQIRYNPVVSTDFPSVSTYTGFRTYITPRLHYFFSEKIYLDVNIPFGITDYYMSKEVSENPNIPIGQRDSGSNNFRLWPAMYSGRIGIGVVI